MRDASAGRGDFGMAVTAVFGFTAILFTWYGVNFVLGSGMHSYGSGAGGQWAVDRRRGDPVALSARRRRPPPNRNCREQP